VQGLQAPDCGCDCLTLHYKYYLNLPTEHLMKVAVTLHHAEERMYLIMLSRRCFGSFISWSRHQHRSIFLLSQATKLHSRHKLNYTETEIRELNGIRWRQEDNHVLIGLSAIVDVIPWITHGRAKTPSQNQAPLGFGGCSLLRLAGQVVNPSQQAIVDEVMIPCASVLHREFR
jgi:hypothetical protein